jgi:hypothetical protein
MGNLCATTDIKEKNNNISKIVPIFNNTCEKKLNNNIIDNYIRKKKEIFDLSKIRRNYSNGIYEGECAKLKRSGYGVFVYKNGNRYEGEWENDKKNGYGIFKYINGCQYEGEWKNDKKNGYGIFKYKNGNRYEGNWENDYKIGKGNYILENGEIYSGDFIGDSANGKGIVLYKNGDKYEGEIKNNILDGKGIMLYANGDIYEGEWEFSLKNGKGNMFYANGDKYEGEWKFDLKNGKGNMFYSNGDKYEGEWKLDLKNGKGIMFYANGDKYEGEWKDDQKNEYGILVYSSNDIYDGYWKNDKKNGEGVIKLSNGFKYFYKWKNGQKIQTGEKIKIQNSNGDIYEGYLIDNIMIGYCVINYKNENIYKGEIKNFVPDGYGIMISQENNDVQVGIWKEGKLTDEKVKFPECGICQMTFEPIDLVPACGNCYNLICISCKNKHYNLPKPGFQVHKSNIICPFCRQFPLQHIYELPEKVIEIMTENNVCVKCKYCLDYEKMDKTSCNDNLNSEDTGNFVCEKCESVEGIKKCPSCHVKILKNGGCNHMTCRQCKYEWCWVCLEKWDSSHLCVNQQYSQLRSLYNDRYFRIQYYENYDGEYY